MDLNPSSSVVAVLAHPDDIKSVTGIVLRALKYKSQVSLILITKGEALTSAARNKLSPLEMGKLRIDELRRYLGLIGFPDKNLFIIGIPDGSHTLPALRDDFYMAEGDPYLDPLLRTDRVIYDDVYKPGLPFHGKVLQKTIQELLTRLLPSIVLTHHPQDDHADHRAVSFFTRRACSYLNSQGIFSPMPPIYAPLVYFQRYSWPPTGDTYYVEYIRNQFPHLKATQFCLTDEELLVKKQASLVFTPTLSMKYIQSNMKKDEVLWRL